MSHLSCSGEQGVDHKQEFRTSIGASHGIKLLATTTRYDNSTRSLPDSLGKKKIAGLFFFFENWRCHGYLDML
jgi:hypothetical protein